MLGLFHLTESGDSGQKEPRPRGRRSELVRNLLGRSPLDLTNKRTSPKTVEKSTDARVAQLVEQRTENPRVGGSNPPPGTTPFAGR